MKAHLAVLALATVAGCYPTAETVEKFPIAATVTLENPERFTDCMMDGLNPMEGWLVNRRDVQQEVRSNGTRIDTSVAAGNIQLSRTEITTDGQATMRIAEYSAVALIDRSPEKNVFDLCAARQ